MTTAAVEATATGESRSAGRTCVYRAFDASGALLYVGISDDWSRRWTQHSFMRPTLFQQTARLDVTWYDARAEALAVEAEAIRTLRPPFNAMLRERMDRPPRGIYGRARFFDPEEPLPPVPLDVSRRPRATIVEAAPQLGVGPKTLRNLLWEFRRDLGPAAYFKPPGKGYRLRLLSEADLFRLRDIIRRCEAAGTMPVNKPVKEKVSDAP